MQLTENEKIKLTRWRLELSQEQFYKGICDQQTGSAIENDSWNGLQSSLDKVIDVIKKKYGCDPKSITVYEFIKILRLRLKIDLNHAAKIINRSRTHIINLEKGKYSPYLMFRIFYKIHEAKNS